MMNKINVMNLGEGKIPSYAHHGDAGLDIHSAESKILEAGERDMGFLPK